MMNNRKATMLIELSVLIITSFILYMAVSRGMSAQNQIINRMAENNDVLLILDGLAQKVKSDYDSGVELDKDYFKSCNEEMIKEGHYILTAENSENGNIELILYVKNPESTYTIRHYKKEVLLNEKK